METGDKYAYQDILQEIGRQLAERKGLLARRTFLIIWPILMLVFVVPIMAIMGEENITLWQVLIIIGFIIFAICYQCVMGAIFAIEKRIWLDSYFDNRTLTPKQSWRIALKLFKPAMQLVLRTAFAYYFLPFFFAITTIYITLMALQSNNYLTNLYDPFSKFIIVEAGSIIILLPYVIYMQTRLRFLWFVFLDHAGQPNYSSSLVLQKTSEIHHISKKETFSKALVTILTASTAGMITDLATTQIAQGLAMASGVSGSITGKVGSNLISVFGKSYARQIVSFGAIASIYILYMQARRIVGGEKQSVNEALYELS
jgi:hypothetical protein